MRWKHALAIGVFAVATFGLTHSAQAQESSLVWNRAGEEACTFFDGGSVCYPPGCSNSDGPSVLGKKTEWHNVFGEVPCPHGGLYQYSYQFLAHEVNGSCNFFDPCNAQFHNPDIWDDGPNHRWQQKASRYLLVSPDPANDVPGFCIPISDSVVDTSVPKRSYLDECPECQYGAFYACFLADGYFDFTDCTCYSTPVIIDTRGNGFRLTSIAAGVVFDLNAAGSPSQMSWTAQGSDDGFLALDRNGNGNIDDGRELFGGATAQPQPTEGGKKNGFRALAVFDETASGGNADGKISQADSVFPQLVVWVDANHNGVSEPGELKSLASVGIQAIHLEVHQSRRTDEHGNIFRYRVKLDANRSVGKWAVDVYLGSHPVGGCANPSAPTQQQ